MQNLEIWCIFGRKMVRNAVHNAFFNTLTMGTRSQAYLSKWHRYWPTEWLTGFVLVVDENSTAEWAASAPNRMLRALQQHREQWRTSDQPASHPRRRRGAPIRRTNTSTCCLPARPSVCPHVSVRLRRVVSRERLYRTRGRASRRDKNERMCIKHDNGGVWTNVDDELITTFSPGTSWPMLVYVECV